MVPARLCQAKRDGARGDLQTTAYDVLDVSVPSDMGLWSQKIPVETLDPNSEAVKIDDRIAPHPGELVITKKACKRLPGH